jgi:hypothetical protein
MKIQTINPKKAAFNFIYSVDNLYRNRMPRLDMRFNSSHETLRLIKKLQISDSEKQKIKEIKRQRAMTRTEKFTNILSNPIVIDFLSNKNNLVYVYNDHLRFYGNRNHWAKTEKDLKILAILKKYN